MAYWQGQFKSKQGHTYTCRIYDRNISYNKTFLFGAESVTLSYQRGETKYVPYKAIMCTMDILTSDDMSTVYSDVPMSNGVTITDENDVIWFDGYLIPSEWKNDAAPGIKHITLTATDALGMLKYRKLYPEFRWNYTLQTLWTDVMEAMNVDNHSTDLSGEGSVSTETFLPDDHTEPQYSDAFGSYEDIINAIGTLTNQMTMIWKGTAYCQNIDTYSSSYWQSSIYSRAENNLLNDNFMVEIVPSYSRIAFRPTGGRKIYIEDILGHVNTDQCKILHTATYSNATETTTATQHCMISIVSGDSPDTASRDFTIQSSGITSSNLILMQTWGEGVVASGDYVPLITGQIRMKSNAMHTVISGRSLYIRCSLMINNMRPWAKSDPESTSQNEESGFVAGSHFGIRISGSLHYPTRVDILTPSDATGFIDVLYTFETRSNGMLEPVLITQGQDEVYLRSIHLESSTNNQYSTYDDHYQELHLLNSSFDRILDVEMPFMTGTRTDATSSFGITPEYKAYVNGGLTATATRLKSQYMEQYRHPRRLYMVTLPLSGFHPFYKVNIGTSSTTSRKCTIDGAVIRLRDDSVDAELLESGV